LVLLENTIFRG